MLAPPVALWLSSVPCVLAAIGCNRAATFTQPIPPFAAIHWVHAVPDTMQEDFRVVDIVSNAGLFDQDFRGSNMFYQGIEAGTRRIRIFNSSPDAGADPGATNVGFRIVHAGAGLGNVDVNLIRHGADTAALPATPLVANVAYGAASAYIAVAADAVAADSLRVVVTAA